MPVLPPYILIQRWRDRGPDSQSGWQSSNRRGRFNTRTWVSFRGLDRTRASASSPRSGCSRSLLTSSPPSMPWSSFECPDKVMLRKFVHSLYKHWPLSTTGQALRWVLRWSWWHYRDNWHWVPIAYQALFQRLSSQEVSFYTCIQVQVSFTPKSMFFPPGREYEAENHLWVLFSVITCSPVSPASPPSYAL